MVLVKRRCTLSDEDFNDWIRGYCGALIDRTQGVLEPPRKANSSLCYRRLEKVGYIDAYSTFKRV